MRQQVFIVRLHCGRKHGRRMLCWCVKYIPLIADSRFYRKNTKQKTFHTRYCCTADTRMYEVLHIIRSPALHKYTKPFPPTRKYDRPLMSRPYKILKTCGTPPLPLCSVCDVWHIHVRTFRISLWRPWWTMTLWTCQSLIQ